MPQVLRVNAVRAKLRKLKMELAALKPDVQVGYTQSYAVFVHEAPPGVQFQRPGAEHKYLEGPAREFENLIGETIVKTVKKLGMSRFPQAIVRGGLLLQRKSQNVVPVDTGALRASAYTALEFEADVKAQQAFQRSEAIRSLKS